jgi:hypothetical protein
VVERAGVPLDVANSAGFQSESEIVDAQGGEAYERVDGLLAGTPLDKLLDPLPSLQRRVVALRYGISDEERTAEQTAAA